jgi:hypothetical protein
VSGPASRDFFLDCRDPILLLVSARLRVHHRASR